MWTNIIWFKGNYLNMVKQGKRPAWTERLSCNYTACLQGPHPGLKCQSSWKQQKRISCYHQSWKQAACKEKNKNNPDKACRTPTQVTQDRTPAHRHTHTHTDAAYTGRIIVGSSFSAGLVELYFFLVGFHRRFCECVLRSFPWLDTLNCSSGPSDFARWCVWLTLQKGNHTFCKTVLFSVFWANSSVSQK